MTKSNYALRIPASLKTEAAKIAAAEGTTLNQLINMAVAEKVSALRTADYIAKRASRGSAGKALKVVSKAGRKRRVAKGDEVA